MKIAVDRDAASRRPFGQFVLFQARDEDGEPLTLEIAANAWDAIQRDRSCDPFAQLEELARGGHWASHETGWVWRAYLIPGATRHYRYSAWG